MAQMAFGRPFDELTDRDRFQPDALLSSWPGSIPASSYCVDTTLGKSWLTFLQNHREVIVALDFFTVADGHFPTPVLSLHHRALGPQDPPLQRRPLSHRRVESATTPRDVFGGGVYRCVILDHGSKF